MSLVFPNKLKRGIPWWLKILAKVLLSRLPIPYSRWRTIGIFQHGFMLDPMYAVEVFDSHYSKVSAGLSPDGWSLLELGPGDSISTAIVGKTYGARKIWLVDVGGFACMEFSVYVPLLNYLSLKMMDAVEFETISDILCQTNTSYLTSGLASLQTIPDNSVDFIFSQAVLEHVPLAEFGKTIQELNRIQKPGTFSSHRIDLQDHLAHNLNSLRFSAEWWESDLFKHSGFYTNRLRRNQINNSFISAGYEITHQKYDRWAELPLKREILHPDFQGFSDDDLLVSGFDLVVRKP